MSYDEHPVDELPLPFCEPIFNNFAYGDLPFNDLMFSLSELMFPFGEPPFGKLPFIELLFCELIFRYSKLMFPFGEPQFGEILYPNFLLATSLELQFNVSAREIDTKTSGSAIGASN